MPMFSKYLPERYRRRIHYKPFGFRRRMLLFFVLYTTAFGAYLFSFVTGGGLGLAIEDTCKSMNDAVFSVVLRAAEASGNDLAIRVADGLLRVVTADFVGVLIAIGIAAFALTFVISAAFAIVMTVKANVDEKPNVYMENGWDERYEAANGTVAPKL